MVHHPQTADRIDDGTDVDTIAAIATPAGVGGIGIVRLSGPDSVKIIAAVAHATPHPRHAQYCAFSAADGSVIDRGIVLFFPAPNSYTGEAVAELQCHGGPVVLNMVLARVLELGARIAEPGEFTQRAYLNGKLDLAQAEAVCDLINSKTEAAVRGAQRSLSGDFSNQVNNIREKMLKLRMFVEAAIDFPEEEIDFLADDKIVDAVVDIRTELARLIDTAARGQVLREGVQIAIAGLPNAGKSSLLNQLAGHERAIVTPKAGTTRDTIDVVVDLEGLAVHLTDTAGLRNSDDPIEQEGVDRAWKNIRGADLVLYLIDITQGLTDADRHNLRELEAAKVLVVWNKIDLPDRLADTVVPDTLDQVSISARRALGIDAIGQYIQQFVGFTTTDEGLFLARRRHLEALQQALSYVDQAQHALKHQRSGELAAQDLSDAMAELGKLVGAMSADELLGEIFATFCIGK